MIAILILNWNEWKDTVECLKSIQQMHYKDYFVVLGDNGSTNESLNEITSFCKGENITVKPEELFEETLSEINPGDVILYNLKTNNGFAKGNNLMVKYCKRFNPDYYFLLNNDTEVCPNFMNVLLSFHKSHTEYDVLTPLIAFYFDKTKTWNAGGKLFWGFRKYHYAERPLMEIKEKEFIKCSFITGCALFFTRRCLMPNGRLFDEAFFFGEEDFELALRFREEGIKQACVLDSIIYHKVGTSSGGYSEKGKMFIHYLNRYINLRLHLSRISFELWRRVNNMYIAYLFKEKFSKSDIKEFVRELNTECYRYEGVNKEYFENKLGIKDSRQRV